MDQKTHEIIDKIAKGHAKVDKRKPFGYLDKNDLYNEIWLICLEKLKDFDHSRGELEHFLRVAVKNRLVNRYKDITKSVRSPCPRCPFFDKTNLTTPCTKFKQEKSLCTKWRNYELSVDSRNSLLNASEPQRERTSRGSIIDIMMAAEIKEIVLDNIDKTYTHDLNQLLSGGKLSKQRVKRLKQEIMRILAEHKTTKKISLPQI